jgi:hypothetical protein
VSEKGCLRNRYFSIVRDHEFSGFDIIFDLVACRFFGFSTRVDTASIFESTPAPYIWRQIK